jgi:hypothetical protein
LNAQFWVDCLGFSGLPELLKVAVSREDMGGRVFDHFVCECLYESGIRIDL